MNKILSVFFALALFFISCHKNKDNFTCTITHPKEGQEFYDDEDIQVSVTTNDNNTNTVLLHIDNKCYTGTSDFPYHLTIRSGTLISGKHTFKTVAQNSEGKQSEASVSVKVKQRYHESPDYVSFTGGLFPKGWETYGWKIAPQGGYDDGFCLYTKTENATVATTKACGNIEFYLKGYCLIYFYVDDVLVEKIYKGSFSGSGSYNTAWQKYEFTFQEGFHTFKWEYYMRSYYSWAGLDAIRFH